VYPVVLSCFEGVVLSLVGWFRVVDGLGDEYKQPVRRFVEAFFERV